MNQKETDEVMRINRELQVANERYEILKMGMVNVQGLLAAPQVNYGQIQMMLGSALAKAERVGTKHAR